MEKDLIIADHKTGKYSQRELSKKYKCSVGFINKIVKSIDKIDEETVNAGIAYRTALAGRDEHSVNAIEHVVNEKTKHLQFINNITLKNLSVMAKKIDENTSIADHKLVTDAIDKASITLGVSQRHANSQIQISNTNAIQNNIEVEWD